MTRATAGYFTYAYNQAPALLDACIRSCLRTGPAQIVLVDDGSDTPIANEWGPKVKLVRIEHAGIPGAYAEAIKHIDCDYMTAIATDDTVATHKLVAQRNHLVTTGAQAVFCDYSVNGQAVMYEHRKPFRKALCTGNRLYLCTAMCKSELFIRYPHPMDMRWCGDWWFALKVEFDGPGWTYLPGVQVYMGSPKHSLTSQVQADLELSVARDKERAALAKQFSQRWRA